MVDIKKARPVSRFLPAPCRKPEPSPGAASIRDSGHAVHFERAVRHVNLGPGGGGGVAVDIISACREIEIEYWADAPPTYTPPPKE